MKCGNSIIFTITALLSIYPCFGFSQTMVDATDKSMHPVLSYHGFTDFMDGRIEQIHNDEWNVEGYDFFISGDTPFVNINGEEISKDTITVGDMVKITFAPNQDNRVLMVELQEKAKMSKGATVDTYGIRSEKNEKIIMKNGVYVNERLP